MSRRSRFTLWLALLALLTPVLLPASAQAPRKSSGKKVAGKPAEAPRPPLPQDLPPVAPTVTYRDGLLTIVAQNSTLLDILTAVRKATGAQLDAPVGAGERVATRLGPGQPRDVLTALLNGSRYDYILLSPAENPGGVRRLILRVRTGGGAVEPPPLETSSGPPPPAPGARTLLPDTSEEDAAPEETIEPAEEVPSEPQAVPAQPPEVKTPEQMQEELRRQQEELQKQQQEQPPE